MAQTTFGAEALERFCDRYSRSWHCWHSPQSTVSFRLGRPGTAKVRRWSKSGRPDLLGVPTRSVLAAVRHFARHGAPSSGSWRTSVLVAYANLRSEGAHVSDQSCFSCSFFLNPLQLFEPSIHNHVQFATGLRGNHAPVGTPEGSFVRDI